MLLKQRVPVAQPDRVLGYEPRDRGFESLQARHRQSSDGSAVFFVFSWIFDGADCASGRGGCALYVIFPRPFVAQLSIRVGVRAHPCVQRIGQTRGDCALCGTPICGALRLARREEVRAPLASGGWTKRVAVVPCVPHTSTARFTSAAPPALKRTQTIHFTRYTAPQTRR